MRATSARPPLPLHQIPVFQRTLLRRRKQSHKSAFSVSASPGTAETTTLDDVSVKESADSKHHSIRTPTRQSKRERGQRPRGLHQSLRIRVTSPAMVKSACLGMSRADVRELDTHHCRPIRSAAPLQRGVRGWSSQTTGSLRVCYLAAPHAAQICSLSTHRTSTWARSDAASLLMVQNKGRHRF